MDVKKRNEAIAGFKASSRDAKVLIISLKAGGVGLNVSSFGQLFTAAELIMLWNDNS